LRTLARALPKPLKPPLRFLESKVLTFRSEARLRERSLRPWKRHAPDGALTWGVALDGHAFVAKAGEHGAFGEGRTILEVGPGYGRLLDSALKLDVPFGKWAGAEISAEKVRHLRERFPSDRCRFTVADAAELEPEGPIDTVLSSLTFKHLYPSFEPVLTNLARYLKPGGTVVIDLIEGRHLKRFQRDNKAFVRWYTRDEVSEILGRCGLTAEFDYVQHDPDHRRLLVVGRKL
jgi:ubiquinone/menaquinone biosynthesis C-methylase UbiE